MTMNEALADRTWQRLKRWLVECPTDKRHTLTREQVEALCAVRAQRERTCEHMDSAGLKEDRDRLQRRWDKLRHSPRRAINSIERMALDVVLDELEADNAQ